MYQWLLHCFTPGLNLPVSRILPTIDSLPPPELPSRTGSTVLIMATLRSRSDIIFLPCGFFFFFFPHLISVAEWMSTMLWPWCEFRIRVWNMRHMAHWKYSTQKWCKKSPSGHHPSTLSGWIFATKACIDRQSEKNLLNSNISSTWPHNMVNFSSLAAVISSLVWAPQLISMGFVSWHRYCMALQ